jgi:hypothetical protein
VQIGGYSNAPYSARYLEAGFETPAMVGNLSQSSARTGRAFGHTKSRRLFSPLGGAERRAGIFVLPRSSLPQTHSPAGTVTQAKVIRCNSHRREILIFSGHREEPNSPTRAGALMDHDPGTVEQSPATDDHVAVGPPWLVSLRRNTEEYRWSLHGCEFRRRCRGHAGRVGRG